MSGFLKSSLNIFGGGSKKNLKVKEAYDEDAIEAEDKAKREKGLDTDIVLVYPIETDEAVREKHAKSGRSCWDMCDG